MNCAWCGTNADGSGSHGICDDCIRSFGIDPAEIHAEIAQENEQASEQQEVILA